MLKSNVTARDKSMRPFFSLFKISFAITALSLLFSIVNLFNSGAVFAASSPCVVKYSETQYNFFDNGTTCPREVSGILGEASFGIPLHKKDNTLGVGFSGSSGMPTTTYTLPEGVPASTVEVTITTGMPPQVRKVNAAVVIPDHLRSKEEVDTANTAKVEKGKNFGSGQDLTRNELNSIAKEYCRAQTGSSVPPGGSLGSSGDDYNDCMKLWFPNMAGDCWEKAHNPDGSDRGKDWKILYSRCLSSGGRSINKSDLEAALRKVDEDRVNAAGQAAADRTESEIERAETKEECETAGGEWDDSAGCSDPNATSSCEIEGGLGYIICPVLSTLAWVGDAAYSYIEETYLIMPASVFVSDGGLFKAWQVFQNIANLVLVLLFLVIIFSQLTSFGLSNYSLKKMLPKLIAVAILMNVSFIICAIAVDVSNILGKSLNDFFVTIANSIGGEALGGGTVSSSPQSSAGNWTTLVALVLSGGAVGVVASGGVGLAFLALVPVLVSVVVSVLMIFFILVGRQVLIILLVSIAPVAFALYLFPNTSNWFSKWTKTFTAMLMVYPMIGLVFGASALSSVVLKESLSASGDDTIMQIIASGIMVIPFLVVPSMLKKSLNSIGNIGGALGKMNAKMSGGLNSKIQDSSLNKNYKANSERRAAMAKSGMDVRAGGRKNPLNWKSRVNRGMIEGARGERGGVLNSVGKTANFLSEGHTLSKGRALDKYNSEQIQKVAAGMPGWTNQDGTLKTADEIEAETKEAYINSGAANRKIGQPLTKKQSDAQINYTAAQINKKREMTQYGDVAKQSNNSTQNPFSTAPTSSTPHSGNPTSSTPHSGNPTSSTPHSGSPTSSTPHSGNPTSSTSTPVSSGGNLPPPSSTP